MIKEIKNYLDLENFNEIKNLLTSNEFPWFLNEFKVEPNKQNKIYDWQFTHIFYRNFTICSQYFNFLNSLINKINPISIVEIKVNLTPAYHKIESFDMHTDFNLKNVKTGIFYINTNDGLTIFENKKQFKSEENKFIYFPCDLKHTGTTHTNTKQRIVLNINWV